MHNNRKLIAPAALAALVLAFTACSQKPSRSESHADHADHPSAQTRSTTVKTTTTSRDTVLRDTTRVLGTPGSPTGSESRGMPGEKPVPGTKKK